MTPKSKMKQRKRTNKSRDAAKADVPERQVVSIPTRDWKTFEAWANRAAEEIEGLKDLARKAPT